MVALPGQTRVVAPSLPAASLMKLVTALVTFGNTIQGEKLASRRPPAHIKTSRQQRNAMGTRHLICIWYQGRWVLAQYGQWDGYPEGQGIRLLAFLSHAPNIEQLKAGLAYLYQPTQEELAQIDREVHDLNERHRQNEEANTAEGRSRLHQFNALNELYPSLSRDTSAKVLGLIARLGRNDSEGTTAPTGAGDDSEETKRRLPVVLELEFANDGLFCEWCYVVDLDAEVLEVYGGCERKTQGHRFKAVGGDEAFVPSLIETFTFKDMFLMVDDKEFLDKFRNLPEDAGEEGDDEDEAATHEDPGMTKSTSDEVNETTA